MRAVLGHLSAQGVDRYKKGPDTETIRDYLLDQRSVLPEALNIYYWVYPSQSVILVRDAAYLDLRNSKPFVAWFIKCFPLAFLVAWDAAPQFSFPVHELGPWRDVSFEYETELPVRLRPLPPDNWPENPSDSHVIVNGREAVQAIKFTRGTKKKD